jgi:hypothetical protein
MDMSCKYIDNDWYCKSPLAKQNGEEIKCICSNYKSCFLFPPEELKDIIQPEKLNNLEKEAKGN